MCVMCVCVCVCARCDTVIVMCFCVYVCTQVTVFMCVYCVVLIMIFSPFLYDRSLTELCKTALSIVVELFTRFVPSLPVCLSVCLSLLRHFHAKTEHTHTHTHIPHTHTHAHTPHSSTSPSLADLRCSRTFSCVYRETLGGRRKLGLMPRRRSIPL